MAAGASGAGRTAGAVRLRPPNNTLDKRAVSWWRLQWLLMTAAPVAVLCVLAVFLPAASTWLFGAAAAVAAVGLVCTAAMPAWWYRVHRWEVTGEAVYVRSGYLWQEWRVAPMSRIQTVDTVRGPLEQMFKLATVTVTTASSKGALRLRGLERNAAADLADRLTRITQATPGDAT